MPRGFVPKSLTEENVKIKSMPNKGFFVIVTFMTLVVAISIGVAREVLHVRQSTNPSPIVTATETSTVQRSGISLTANTGTSRLTSSFSSSSTNIIATGTSSSEDEQYPGWRLYLDPQNRFSFSYPPDWQLDTSTPNQILFNTSFPGLGFIDLYDKGESQNLIDFWRSEISSTWILVTSTPIKLGPYRALNVEENVIPGTQSESASWSDLLLTNEKGLVADFSPSPLDMEKEGDSVPYTILISFRFSPN